jgi:predicted secreted protein
MRKLFVLVSALFFVNGQVSAKPNMVRVKAIGSSPKGQFVAFEEFGYKDGNRKVPFSKIRVMNMWKNKYVEKPVNIIGNSEKENLSNVRDRAKELAHQKLKKFNISI